MHKKNKSNLVFLIATCLLLGLAAILLSVKRSSSSFKSRYVDFAVEDTASIRWIFLADNDGCRVLLQRQDEGHWLLNKKQTAMQENVVALLSVVQNIAVKAPVAKSAQENVNKWLATGANKVQIAYSDQRIRLGKLRFWTYEHVKTYYIGTPTQDNLGNYAIMEGGKMPFVVYQPGFRGFISPYYSAMEADWVSHQLVNLRISEIKKVVLKDMEDASASLRIERHGERHFDIFNESTGEMLPVYDTLKLYDHLGSYRNLNFEFAVKELGSDSRDSILSLKFKELTLTDIKGNETKLSFYRMLNEFNTEEFEYNEDFMDIYNRDKFYITVGDNLKDFYVGQFFVFDRILQSISYYYPENETIAIPR